MIAFSRPLLCGSLLIPLLLSPVSLSALGLIVVDDVAKIAPPRHPHPPHPPHPPLPPIPPRPPRPIHRHLPLDLERQQVEVEIRGQVADTEVRQVFRNPTSHRLEGTFLFPVPAGAQVSDFSMDIDGEQVKAELLDAGKARKIYEDIVRRVRDPALFEYAGQELFKVRIFPIEPRARKEVRIRYTELLRKDGDVMRYVYPLSPARHRPEKIPEFSLEIDLRSGGGRALKTVYSPSHDVEIQRKGRGRAVLGMEEDDLRTEDDFVLYISEKPPGSGLVDLDFLTHHERGADAPGHFLVLLTPAAWEGEVAPLEKDVVFVFDSSGSMRGEKMEQAKAALKYCIEGLHEGDRFEMIRFSTEAEAVFEELVPVNGENRDAAKRFLDDVEAIGGTAIEQALTQAMRTASAGAQAGRPAHVVFLTDGKPTLGATHEQVILKTMAQAKREGSGPVRVFSLGIGTAVNPHLLDLLTEETRAAGEYVLPDENLEEKLSRFFAKISDPVLTGLELKWEGVEWVRDRAPRELPDLFRGQQLVVLGRYRRAEEEGRLILRGSFGNEERIYHVPFSLGDESSETDFLPRLWASRRVGYLLDQVRLHGESRELKEEIAELAHPVYQLSHPGRRRAARCPGPVPNPAAQGAAVGAEREHRPARSARLCRSRRRV